MPEIAIPNDPEWQWVYDLILYTLGEQYPKADPAALRAMAEELTKAAFLLLSQMDSTAALSNTLQYNLDGPAAESFAAFAPNIISGLPMSSNMAVRLAAAADEFALDSEATQYSIVIAAFTIVVEIAIAMATGFGAAAVPGLIKIGQQIVRQLLDLFKHRLKNLLARTGIEALQEGGQEMAEQAGAHGMQIADGNRTSVDGKEVLTAGAAGFAVGFVVAGGLGVIHKWFPDLNHHLVTREVIAAALEVVGEGLVMLALTGNFNPLATFVSGLVTGLMITKMDHWADGVVAEMQRRHEAAMNPPPPYSPVNPYPSPQSTDSLPPPPYNSGDTSAGRPGELPPPSGPAPALSTSSGSGSGSGSGSSGSPPPVTGGGSTTTEVPTTTGGTTSGNGTTGTGTSVGGTPPPTSTETPVASAPPRGTETTPAPAAPSSGSSAASASASGPSGGTPPAPVGSASPTASPIGSTSAAPPPPSAAVTDSTSLTATPSTPAPRTEGLAGLDGPTTTTAGTSSGALTSLGSASDTAPSTNTPGTAPSSSMASNTTASTGTAPNSTTSNSPPARDSGETNSSGGRTDRTPPGPALSPHHLTVATSLPTPSTASPSVSSLPVSSPSVQSLSVEGGLPGLESSDVPAVAPAPSTDGPIDGEVLFDAGDTEEPAGEESGTPPAPLGDLTGQVDIVAGYAVDLARRQGSVEIQVFPGGAGELPVQTVLDHLMPQVRRGLADAGRHRDDVTVRVRRPGSELPAGSDATMPVGRTSTPVLVSLQPQPAQPVDLPDLPAHLVEHVNAILVPRNRNASPALIGRTYNALPTSNTDLAGIARGVSDKILRGGPAEPAGRLSTNGPGSAPVRGNDPARVSEATVPDRRPGPSTIDTFEALSDLADQIAGKTRVVPADDPLTDPASCVALLGKAFGRLHDRIAPIPAAARTVDDSVLDGRQTSRLVGGAELAAFGAWADLETRLIEAAGQAGPGKVKRSTALVLIERGEGVGHAIMAHLLPTGQIAYVDLHRDPGERVLPPGQRPDLSSARASAVVLDGNGTEVTSDENTGNRTVDALIDPASDHRYGKGGTEAEHHGAYLELPAGWHDQWRTLAVNRRLGLRAVIDSGTFLRWQNNVGMLTVNAPRDAVHEVESIIEILTEEPLAELPGDPPTKTAAAVIGAQQQMLAFLRHLGEKALRTGFRELGYTLDQVFPESDGWELGPHAEQVRFVPVITQGQPTVSMHHTKGVPIGAVREFLDNLTPRIWEPRLRRMHQSGRSFAASVREHYQSSFSPRFNNGLPRPAGRPTADELNELEGAMWVTYDHVAGLAMAALTSGQRGKQLSPIAMRQSLRAMRNELSAETRRFLEQNVELIELTFEATLLADVRDYSARYVQNVSHAAQQHAMSPQYHQAPAPVAVGRTVRPLDAVRYARSFETHQRPTVSVREYLRTMLVDNAPQMNQHQAFGVRTFHNDLDRARSTGRGLLLFELRNDSAALIHPEQILPQYRELRTIVQEAVAHAEPENYTLTSRISRFSTSGWPFAATGFRGVPPGTDTTPLPSAYTPQQLPRRFPLLDQINPHRDTHADTDTNCVIAAITYVLARDERTPVEASGSTELPGADLINFQRQRLDLSDDEHRVWLTPSIEALTDAMQAGGEGTLVLLADRGDNGHISHVYVGEVDHRGVTFLNPQTGELAALPVTTTALAVLPLTHGMPMPADGRKLTAAEAGTSAVDRTGAAALPPGQMSGPAPATSDDPSELPNGPEFDEPPTKAMDDARLGEAGVLAQGQPHEPDRDDTVPAESAGAWDRELELRFGGLAGPAELQTDERDEAGEPRLNPFWWNLPELPPSLVIDNPEAHWIFTVGADGGIRVGGETPVEMLSGPAFDQLLAGMRRVDPTLTADDLRRRLNQGHPTVGVDFDDQGRTVVSPARFAGELLFDRDSGEWTVNDLSGRYMQPFVRDHALPRDLRWQLSNVAEEFSRYLGVPVRSLPPTEAEQDPDEMPSERDRTRHLERQARAIADRYVHAAAADRDRIATVAADELRDPGSPVERAIEAAAQEARQLGLSPAVEVVPPVTPPTAEEELARDEARLLALAQGYLSARVVRSYGNLLFPPGQSGPDPLASSRLAATHAFLLSSAADVFHDVIDRRSPDREFALAAGDVATGTVETLDGYEGVAYLPVRTEDLGLLPVDGESLTVTGALVASMSRPGPEPDHTVLRLGTRTALDADALVEDRVLIRPDSRFRVDASDPRNIALIEVPERLAASADGPAFYATARVLDVGHPIEQMQLQLPAMRAVRAEDDLKSGDENLTLVLHPLAPPPGTEPMSLDPRALYVVHETTWDDNGLRVELLELSRPTRAARAGVPAEVSWAPLPAGGPLATADARDPQDAHLLTAAQTTRLRFQRLRLVPSARLDTGSLDSLLSTAGAGAFAHHDYLAGQIQDDPDLTPDLFGLPADADLASMLDGPEHADLLPALIAETYELAVVVIRPDGSLMRFQDLTEPDRPAIVLIQTTEGLRPAVPDTGTASDASPSTAVAAAVEELTDWDRVTPDCVTRVASVLVRLGGNRHTRDEDNLDPANPAAVTAALGAERFQATSPDTLGNLQTGAITAIRVHRPHHPMHIVLAERLPDGTLILIETQANDSQRYIPLNPALHPVPTQLAGPIFLPVTTDGRLAQLDPERGLTSNGTITIDNTLDALLDPSTSQQPGMDRSAGAGPPSSREEDRIVDQLVAASLQVPAYASRETSRGPLTSATDRGTLDLIRAVADSLSTTADATGVLDLAAVEPLVHTHARPHRIWRAALRVLDSRSGHDRIRFVRDLRETPGGRWRSVRLPAQARRLFTVVGHATLHAGEVLRPARHNTREEVGRLHGGDARQPPAPMSVPFEEQRSGTDDVPHSLELVALAQWLEEEATIARATNGPLPAVAITGHGNGRLGFSRSALAQRTGSRRAHAVRAFLTRQLTAASLDPATVDAILPLALTSGADIAHGGRNVDVTVRHTRSAPRNSGSAPAAVDAALGALPPPGGDMLARLRAARRPQPGKIDPRLGPDLFGRTVSPPPPPFLDGVRFSDFAATQLTDLFHRLDLAHGRVPHRREFRPENIAHRAETAWQREVPPDRREWAADSSRLPAQLQRLPESIEMPLVVELIWLGGPLVTGQPATAQFRMNVETMSRAQPDWTFVILTDIPREQFIAAHQGPGTPEWNRLAGVREMAEWLNTLPNVVALNVGEIFNQQTAPDDFNLFWYEWSKRIGRGFAGGSDILRLRWLWQFGGLHMDGDTVLPDFAQLRARFEDRGFAFGGQGLMVTNNDVLLATRNHPFVQLYLDHIAENFHTDQRTLMNRRTTGRGGEDLPYGSRQENWNEFGDPSRLNRYSVLSRTGPFNLFDLGKQTGMISAMGRLRGYASFPVITGVKDMKARSWVPTAGGTGSAVSLTDDEEFDLLTSALTTLIRNLWFNRRGDLHLTLVEPVVNRLRDPSAGWRTLLQFIREDPDLSPIVRSATDRTLIPGYDAGPYEAPGTVHIVALPPDVRGWLWSGLDSAQGDPDGNWWLAELQRPVDINAWQSSPQLAPPPYGSQFEPSGPSSRLGAGRTPAADDISGLSWWHPDNPSGVEPAKLFPTRHPWVLEINADNRSAVSDHGLVNCFYSAIAMHQSWDGDQIWPAPDPGETAPWSYALEYANSSSGGQDIRALTEVTGYDTIAAAYHQQAATGQDVHGFVIVVETGRVSHVYNVVGTAEGVLFIDSLTGEPASLPAEPQHIVHVSVGETTVDVAGRPYQPDDLGGTVQDGHMPPSPATLDDSSKRRSDAVPDRRTEALRRLGTPRADPLDRTRLDGIAADIVAASPGDDPGACLNRLTVFRDKMFPAIRHAGTRDDSVHGTGPARNPFGAPAAWPRIDGLRSLLPAMRELPAGSVAFVLVDTQDADKGNAVLLYNMTDETSDGSQPPVIMVLVELNPARAGRYVTDLDVAPDPLDELLTGLFRAAVETRALVVDNTGTIRDIVPVATQSASPAQALLDRPTNLSYKGSGLEAEFTEIMVLVGIPDPNRVRGRDLVIWRTPQNKVGFRLTVETKVFYLGADDKLYRTEQGAKDSGGTGEPELTAILEFVSGVLADYPSEVDRLDPGPVWDALERLEQQLAGLTGEEGADLPGTDLEDLFAGNGFEVTDLGQTALIGRRPIGDWAGAHFHTTIGVVQSGLYDLLDHVAERTWRTVPRYNTLAHLRDSLTLGREVAARYFVTKEFGAEALEGVPDHVISSLPFPRQDRSVAIVAGHIALLASNAAALAEMQVHPGLGKELLAVASRVTMQDSLLNLDRGLQDFLAADMEFVWRRFEQLFRDRVPTFDDRLRKTRRLAADLPIDLKAVRYEPSVIGGENAATTERHRLTIHAYVESGLNRKAARIDQFRSVNVGTTLEDLDWVDEPLVVLEVRSYGQRHASVRTARADHQRLVAVAVTAYDRERAWNAGPAGTGVTQTERQMTDRLLRAAGEVQPVATGSDDDGAVQDSPSKWYDSEPGSPIDEWYDSDPASPADEWYDSSPSSPAPAVLAEEQALRPAVPDTGTATDPSPSNEVAAAVAKLTKWDGSTPDCLTRVESVLTRLSGDQPIRHEEALGAADTSAIAATLGAEQFRPTSLGSLDHLQSGAITVIRVHRPDNPMHVVLVERLPDGDLILIETQADESRRYTRLDPALHPMPIELAGPTFMPVTTGGQLAQLTPGHGLTPSGTVTTDHSLDALLDPATSHGPGMRGSGRRAGPSSAGRPGPPVPPVEQRSAELVARLRSAEDRVAMSRHSPVEPANPLLGPDLFDARRPPPPWPGMPLINVAQMRTAQAHAFFETFDLLSAVPPHPRLRVEDLQVRPHSVWSVPPQPGRTYPALPIPLGRWRQSLDDGLRPMELSRTWFAIWFGGAFSGPAVQARRNNLANLVQQAGPEGWQVVLVTDLPRILFDQARARPADFPEVADMMAWVERVNAGQPRPVLRVVNVHEVLPNHPAVWNPEHFMLEQNRQTTVGSVSASDIGRWYLLRNFGGIYFDTDNVLLDFRPFSPEFTSSGFGTRTNNDVIMAARGHVFVENYIASIAQRYTLTQQELYALEAGNYDNVWSQTSEQQNRELVGGGRAHRRYSVHARTGPQNIVPATLALGYNNQFPVRAIPRNVVTMGAEGTWIPRGESPLRPRRRYQHAEVDVVLQRVVTTLLRELRNRSGDLHLTAVASVIAGLPDPEAAWDAVLTFILDRPHDNAAITTVTHGTMYPTGPNTTAMDQVPQAVLLRLGLHTSAPGFWRLGEFTSQMPRPPQPGDSGGGHSSGWGGPSHPSWPGGYTQASMADTSDSMTRGLDLAISDREKNLRGRGLNPDEDKTLQALRAHRATYPEHSGSSTPAAPAQDQQEEADPDLYEGVVDDLGVTSLKPPSGELAALPATLADPPINGGRSMPGDARMLTADEAGAGGSVVDAPGVPTPPADGTTGEDISTADHTAQTAERAGAALPDASASTAVAEADPVTQQLLAVRKGLEDRLGRVLAPLDAEAGPGAFEDCLLRLDAVTRDRFGNRPTVTRDDSALDTGRLQDELAARLGGDWRRVQHSLTPVVQRLEELGDGSLALVLHSPPGRERHGIVLLNQDGHVFTVETQAKRGERVRTWNQRDSEGLPVLSIVGTRVVIADPGGKAVPLTGSGTESVVPGTSTGEALVDDAHGLRYLGSGTENEFTNVILFSKGRDRTLHGTDEGSYLGEVLARGPAGTLFTVEEKQLFNVGYPGQPKEQRTWHWYRPVGHNLVVQQEQVGIGELIAGVMSSLPGERGENRASVHKVRRELESALDSVHRESSREGFRSLASVLRPLGWQITELGKRAFIGARPIGGWAGSNMQHNHAVPLAGLRHFLESILPATYRNSNNGYYWMQEHLYDGLQFGKKIATRYSNARGAATAAADEGAEIIWGAMAAHYVAIAGAAASSLLRPDDANRKNHAAALLRHPPAQVLAEMPGRVKAFLAEEYGTALRELQESVERRIPAASSWWSTPIGVPILEYLGSAMVTDHHDAEDIYLMTQVDIDRSMPLPRVVVEVRAYRQRSVNAIEAQSHAEELVAAETAAYQKAQSLSPDIRVIRTMRHAGTEWQVVVPIKFNMAQLNDWLSESSGQGIIILATHDEAAVRAAARHGFFAAYPIAGHARVVSGEWSANGGWKIDLGSKRPGQYHDHRRDTIHLGDIENLIRAVAADAHFQLGSIQSFTPDVHVSQRSAGVVNHSRYQQYQSGQHSALPEGSGFGGTTYRTAGTSYLPGGFDSAANREPDPYTSSPFTAGPPPYYRLNAAGPSYGGAVAPYDQRHNPLSQGPYPSTRGYHQQEYHSPGWFASPSGYTADGYPVVPVPNPGGPSTSAPGRTGNQG